MPSSHREPAFIAPKASFHSFSPIHSGLVLGSRVSLERAREAVSPDETGELPLDNVEPLFMSLYSGSERLDRRFCFPSLLLSFSMPLPLLRSADADVESAEGLDRLDLPLDSEASVVGVFFVVRELFSGLVVCSPSSCLLREDRLRRSASFPSVFRSVDGVVDADGVVDRASVDGASEAFSAVPPGVDVSRGFFVLVSTSLPFSSPPAAELAEPEPTSVSFLDLRLLLSFAFVSARLRDSLASLVSPSTAGEELEPPERLARLDPDSLPLSLVLAAASAFAFFSARARRRASLSSLLSATSLLAPLPEEEDDLRLDRELFAFPSVPDVEVGLEERVFVPLDVGGVVLVSSFSPIGAPDEELSFLSRSRSPFSRDDERELPSELLGRRPPRESSVTSFDR